MGDVKTFVDSKISGKKVMVFSKSYCPFCSKAKKALANYKLSDEEYEVLEIDNHPECSEIQDYLLKLTGGRSVPRVFINGNFIGGGDETVKLHENDKLGALIKA